jgi:hypothetical protein
MGAGYCFWHDKHIDKSGMDLSERLEAYAKEGGMLQGVQLKRTQLNRIRLVNRGKSIGFDMRNADLYRADMSDAHLFNINLSGSSLMKTKLHYADLHCANLTDTNLLGVKLVGCRIDNIKIGEEIQQEKQAKEAEANNEKEKSVDLFEQSEEIYRNLRKSAEADGLASFAGYCTLKELTMRRKQFPRYSSQRLKSKLVDLFCGYGEKPANVISFSMSLIFISALFFYAFGIEGDNGIIQFNLNSSFQENVSALLSSIYFSVVTFTTLGYGDIHPIGISRVVATIEAFVGSFALALYVVVFVTKNNR